MMRVLSVALAALALGLAAADSPARVGGTRTLAILDDAGMRGTHSVYFNSLKEDGHNVEFKTASDSNIKLEAYGDYLYDNIVIFSSSADSFGNLEVSDIVKFVDEGGNLVVATGSNPSDVVRDLAAECGVDFDNEGTMVIDHQFYDPVDPDQDHTLIVASNVVDNKYVFPKKFNPVLYQGIGHMVNEDNILALPFLRGHLSTYSANPNEPMAASPQSMGQSTLLVTGVQARNNARAVFSGSLYLFSDAAFARKVSPLYLSSTSISGNKEFAVSVTRWAFQQQGVIRIKEVAHMRSDGAPAALQVSHADRPDLPRSIFPEPEIARASLTYRIKDNITYAVTIEQLNGNKWGPYEADDVQLEFVMLDPYVRKTLAHVGNGNYVGDFLAPDSYGIFKFRLLYRRPGLSVLHREDQVNLRPFAHNEYERFIFSAYPYYFSAMSMMAGVFVFTIVFLFSSRKVKSD